MIASKSQFLKQQNCAQSITRGSTRELEHWLHYKV